MSLKTKQSVIEHQQVSLAEEPARVREALVLSALDYPLAELSRKNMVLSLWAIAAKKNQEGGRMSAGKVSFLSSLPQARSGSINLLVFNRNDTLEPHRCHLSLEAAGCDEWCSFLRDLHWMMPHPHPSLPSLIGCNPSPSQQPPIQPFVI